MQLAPAEWLSRKWAGGVRKARLKLARTARNLVTRRCGRVTTIVLRLAKIELGGAGAVKWADTQLGAPYAAVWPYRFGWPPWPGGTVAGDRGRSYCFPAGTIVYDCSGFVVAAWRATGVDLLREYGVYGSQDLVRSALGDVDPAGLMPGDLAVYTPGRDGVGHVVMIHHIDIDGVVHTIEAADPVGVTAGTINWARVGAIKRPPSPRPPRSRT